MVLYHNTRCSKSRETLQLLESKNVNPEIVEYMKEPITPGDLEEILDKLDIDAIDLVRKKEAIWKEEFADKELTEDEVILAMIEYPQLMERPILVNGDKARVGRPPEDVLEII
ncbi:arsenate reductase (glutaredoxin) [Owenweeksia hongkongensis]|uniref:Glutaredoxin-dependent arsenate reductase n=1 Tax=Owenweeksia hongkongensis (strain DSM 17368 / CIP 108786 / JCM 12287 / NRRL B-23963 / UST20020801) TaxID=926562 RepID=G8R159_OWEHD|nr:arsenate reductase (glutaredoxin) [Owenweeksia hongkongensis]AEV32774.1 glutaredoxin-dependent arsenate reductase [Owenweeksia hongkongensis DSM 17368]